VLVLSDATNGYISQLQIYTGKNIESGHVDAGLCSHILLDLMSGVGEGFYLCTNNYYTGPVVYKALYDQGINSSETIRTNGTGFPKVLKKEKVKKYQEDTMSTFHVVHSWLLCGMTGDLPFLYPPSIRPNEMETQYHGMLRMVP